MLQVYFIKASQRYLVLHYSAILAILTYKFNIILISQINNKYIFLIFFFKNYLPTW